MVEIVRPKVLLAGFAALLLATVSPRGAMADTVQELPVAGLSFSRTPGIAIDLEEVGVTLDAVVFRYRLVNGGSTPASVDIDLTLPKLDFSDADEAYALPAGDPVNFLGATLSVDGAPTTLPFRQTAMIDTRDVTRPLREANLPLLMSDDFQTRLAALPPDRLAKLLVDGLLRQNGAKDTGTALLFPAWSVRTSATVRQRVDPGQPLLVEVRALASLGASQDTILRKALRQQDGLLPDVDRLRKRFCIDDAFIGGIDKIAGASDENGAHVQERRLDLLLAPPPPRDVPVGNFHLTLDKGKPDNLISTCLNDLKKTSATSFEVRTSNTAPPRSLHILIIGRF